MEVSGLIEWILLAVVVLVFGLFALSAILIAHDYETNRTDQTER